MGLPDQFLIAAEALRERSNQWKAWDELESIQDQKLASLLQHARANVPHYAKSLSGMSGTFGLASLPDIPILSKADIRSGARSFISRGLDVQSLHKFTTSGTTGQSLMHYMSHEDGITGGALRLNTFMQCGFAPGDRLAMMTFSKPPAFPLQPFLFRVKSMMPWQDADNGFGALKASSPDIVCAYPSILSVLADANLECGNPIRFRKAITVSEVLRESVKLKMAESFGCSIRNYYGASECWAIAWECEKGSLHVNSDNVIVEAVGDDGRPVPEGRSGRLLITPLWRRAMPFIRYDIGDWGSLGHGCRCGRGLHVIKTLEGRTTDFVILPSGRRLPWIFLEIPIIKSDRFVSYQVVQEKDGSLDVKIVLAKGTAPGADERLLRGLRASLPEKLEISVRIVDEIQRGPRGKMRDFISRMSQAP